MVSDHWHAEGVYSCFTWVPWTWAEIFPPLVCGPEGRCSLCLCPAVAAASPALATHSPSGLTEDTPFLWGNATPYVNHQIFPDLGSKAKPLSSLDIHHHSYHGKMILAPWRTYSAPSIFYSHFCCPRICLRALVHLCLATRSHSFQKTCIFQR